jgi:hypothetical protein
MREYLMNNTTRGGTCFCGAVEFSVKDEPELMGYCHCESCRHWSASPVNAFSIWKKENFNIIHGEDNIGSYNKTPGSIRKWCASCGGHIYTEHPEGGVVDVYAVLLPDLEFTPAIHTNYQESVLPIKDGLPKLKDMPKEIGGSGELIPE